MYAFAMMFSLFSNNLLTSIVSLKKLKLGKEPIRKTGPPNMYGSIFLKKWSELLFLSE